MSLNTENILPEISMVEICDNGLDDDNNGWIDLNDPACDCAPPEPVSQIPNPSFEETVCCPTNRGQLNCAVTWIQASEATTDYYNRCGYFTREEFPVPEPIPDGDAYIGFRNGRFTGDNPNPNWKEYTGACLLSPLLAGNEYTFQFHIGFLDQITSPPIRVAFYGTSSCENLPFGVGDREFGCPLNDSTWVKLGEVYVSGFNQWQQYTISSIPDENIAAIAIGPECREAFREVNPYYFLDNLILADTRLFGPSIQSRGNPCAETFQLEASEKRGATYQWYRDGIALVGEDQRQLQVNRIEGNYQVRTLSDSVCSLSDAYLYRLPRSTFLAEQKICAGEVYSFGQQRIASEGQYTATFRDQNGCDSIVSLTLRIQKDLRDTLEAYYFEGEKFRIGPYRFSAPTERPLAFTTSIGCDSIVQLSLKKYPIYLPNAISPNLDGINDEFRLYGDLSGLEVESLQIYDRWGNLIYQEEGPGPPTWNGRNPSGEVKPGIYLYQLQLLLPDGQRKILSSELSVLR
ncbi:MAG TPA: gliding motility-associated C-terminal domain-containing protein [Saprospiraceae bacterium]|nr:gliding motility-associated C-terminal domain-containing protein [Saprospiraceae bacterium]